jgi:3-hydroxymyristoyl/3-hydroxydecanoyl-(acyl carrier protein) dehydratase
MNMLLPQVSASHTDDTKRLVLTLHIHPELDYFVGHFPDLPLLPGVVQVDWATKLAREHLQIHGEFVSLENLKFQAMILPAATVTLTLEWLPDSGRLNFEYRQADQPLSSGRMCFKARGTA